MPVPALTYDELKALHPCEESLRRVARLMGGAKKWDGKKVDAAAARAAGVTFDDIVWAASAISLNDPDVERRLLLCMADWLAHIADVISDGEARAIFDRCVTAQRRFARERTPEADAEWKEAARAAWAAWDARAAWAARAAWDARAARAAWAAWDARAAWAAWAARDAEQAWQFDRLIARLSDPEPEDYPLPERGAAQEAA